MNSPRYIHGSQSPADCEVFGQDVRVFNLRNLAFQAAAVGTVGCVLIVAAMAVTV